MLVASAAKQWEVSPDTCKAQGGQVVHGNPKRYLSYGELVEAAAKLPIPNLNTVPLKNSDDFTLVGHDTRRFEVRQGYGFREVRHRFPRSRNALCRRRALSGFWRQGH